jgi:hypothetical protein
MPKDKSIEDALGLLRQLSDVAQHPEKYEPSEDQAAQAPHEETKNLDRDTRAWRRFYEFNDDDLYYNRLGKLSPKQTETVESVGRTLRTVNSALSKVFLLLGGGIILFSLLAMFLIWAINDPDMKGLYGVTVMGLVIGSGMFWIGISFKRYVPAKARTNYVLRTVQGPVHLTKFHIRTNKDTTSYVEHHMQFGDVEFVLEDELVKHIKEGENYAVYYLDYQDGSEGIIQSAERLDAPGQPKDER